MGYFYGFPNHKNLKTSQSKEVGNSDTLDRQKQKRLERN